MYCPCIFGCLKPTVGDNDEENRVMGHNAPTRTHATAPGPRTRTDRLTPIRHTRNHFFGRPHQQQCLAHHLQRLCTQQNAYKQRMGSAENDTLLSRSSHKITPINLVFRCDFQQLVFSDNVRYNTDWIRTPIVRRERQTGAVWLARRKAPHPKKSTTLLPLLALPYCCDKSKGQCAPLTTRWKPEARRNQVDEKSFYSTTKTPQSAGTFSLCLR